MLDRSQIDYAEVPGVTVPRLLVVVDTEEEFDWAKPLARGNTGVTSIQYQDPAQEIFAKYGLVPTYVVDHPVATSDLGVEVLSGYLKAGICEVGAHLHPWVSPPHEEEVTPFNSYAGNLPEELERAKLTGITRTIAETMGTAPRVFRAGRWGAGPATGQILEDLGYLVDTSIVPRTDFSADGGPCYLDFDHRPYWIGTARRLLELPQTAGFAGLLKGAGPALYPSLSSSLGMALHGPGFAARLGLLERIRLTPEGMDLGDLCRLTLSLLAQGNRIFILTYHSPSLKPGCTPYVRDRDDLAGFLTRLEQYLDYFCNRIGGRPGTLLEVYEELKTQTASRSAKKP